ncbi:unnamed protein product, partial [Symbiodinium necroappetens]
MQSRSKRLSLGSKEPPAAAGPRSHSAQAPAGSISMAKFLASQNALSSSFRSSATVDVPVILRSLLSRGLLSSRPHSSPFSAELGRSSDLEAIHNWLASAMPSLRIRCVLRVECSGAAAAAYSSVSSTLGPERLLWHGTSWDCVGNIAQNGFNRGYSGRHGSKLGRGSYFAEEPAFALRFCGRREPKAIFLAGSSYHAKGSIFDRQVRVAALDAMFCCCEAADEQNVSLKLTEEQCQALPDPRTARALQDEATTVDAMYVVSLSIDIRSLEQARAPGIVLDATDSECPLVRSVREDGLAATWNSVAEEGRRIRTFDHLVEMNGFRGPSLEMARLITRRIRPEGLCLTLQRPLERRVRLQLPGEVGVTLHYKKHGCLCPWIAELDPAGLMARWNMEKPQERVGLHDRILEVNGTRGPPWVLIEEAMCSYTDKVPTLILVSQEVFHSAALAVKAILHPLSAQSGHGEMLCSCAPKIESQVLAPCTLKAEVQVLSPKRLSDPGYPETTLTPPSFLHPDAIPDLFEASCSTSSGSLGLLMDATDPSCLIVKTIERRGAIPEWNEVAPEGKRVSKYDRVTEVNGEGGESEELMERLLSLDLTLFTITVQRPEARLVKLHLPGDTGMSVDCEKAKSAVPWISRISNGLLKSWNEDMPEQSVAVHDRIVSVNGCAGSSELILDRLALAEKTIELL